MMLRKPTCADCPHNLQYMERLPIKKKGVTMHLGERFCVAGKRARKFKRSDPKTYVPSWCPRLKAPVSCGSMASRIRENGGCTAVCARIWARILLHLHSAMRCAMKDIPIWHRMSFSSAAMKNRMMRFWGAAVQHYDVVEIDDGIKPAFSTKRSMAMSFLFSFDAKTAKKNIREEID